MSVRWQDLHLFKTCQACPEQYDALYSGRTVGYLRLRHGNFRVECPDIGGEEVYQANPEGDGMFEDNERNFYLTAAKQAIAAWCNRNNIEPELNND